jgi:hypothetical protein
MHTWSAPGYRGSTISDWEMPMVGCEVCEHDDAFAAGETGVDAVRERG